MSLFSRSVKKYEIEYIQTQVMGNIVREDLSLKS